MGLSVADRPALPRSHPTLLIAVSFTALYAIAPRLPWSAGIPLVALASLGGLGVTIESNNLSSTPAFVRARNWLIRLQRLRVRES
jgi:hypothetical protein